MEPYLDVGGDSGIAAYEFGPDFIRVGFKDGAIYLYTYASAGSDSIEHMKVLAKSGDGLNSYINRHVRKRYAARES